MGFSSIGLRGNEKKKWVRTRCLMSGLVLGRSRGRWQNCSNLLLLADCYGIRPPRQPVNHPISDHQASIWIEIFGLAPLDLALVAPSIEDGNHSFKTANSDRSSDPGPDSSLNEPHPQASHWWSLLLKWAPATLLLCILKLVIAMSETAVSWTWNSWWNSPIPTANHANSCHTHLHSNKIVQN